MDEQQIERIIKDSIESKSKIPVSKVLQASNFILNALQKANRIYVCGNGGSAADAQHMAGEFVNKFKFDRNPLPCQALTTDTSTITAIANDYSFDEIFSKQIEAVGQPGDVLIAISTSGRSRNVIRAVESGKKLGIFTIGFLGKDGGILKDKCDLSIIIPSNETPRIQECHELIMHIICELVEKEYFNHQP